MNKKILENIIKNKHLFVPLIFTEKQLTVIIKYNKNLKLTNAEKKALYTSVRKKIEALSTISIEQTDYSINSPDKIIKERLKKARIILDEYRGNKAFISGSFLFSEDYNDIDIFIIRKKGYKEKWEKDRHIIMLSEKRLKNPVFQSASMISVSNFIIERKLERKKPSLSEIMTTYHEAVIEFLKKDSKPESIRRIIFNYNLFCRNKILDGKELRTETDKIKIDNLDYMIKGLCKKLFSKTYLYVEIHEYIKTLTESIKKISLNDHLVRYRKTYEEMIYGRIKTEIA